MSNIKLFITTIAALAIIAALLLPATIQGSISTSATVTSIGYIQNNPAVTPAPTTTSAPTPTNSPTPTQTPTNPPTPTPTGTYSYIMDISGSNYRILNSARSPIYTSTSSSIAFNWLLGSGGHANSGNTVYVEAGAYLVDSTWNINVNSVTVTFASTMPSSPNVMGNYVGSGTTSSSNGAILTAANYLDNTILKVTGNSVVISGLTVDGNGIHQTQANTGILEYNGLVRVEVWSSNCLIEYSTFHDMAFTAIMVISGSNSGIQNCLLYNIGWNGFESYAAPNAFCINSEVYYCNDVAIDSYALNGIFKGNYVHDLAGGSLWHLNAYWGIGLEVDAYAVAGGTGSGNYFLIAGNVLSNFNGPAIVCSASGGYSESYILISGNTVTNCNSGWYGAIGLDWVLNSIIEFNTLNNCILPIGIGMGETGHSGHGAWTQNNNVYGNVYNGSPIGQGSPYITDWGTGTTYTQLR